MTTRQQARVMRSLMILGWLVPAGATHPGGAMNDAMIECVAANRPDFMALMAPGADVASTGLSLNASPFIYDMGTARNVVGYTEGGTRTSGSVTSGSVNCHATMNSPDAVAPQDLTTTATIDNSAIFGCICEKRGAMVEAIFQPVGCAVCAQMGFPLPCQTEFDACQVATTRADGFTRTAAGMDIVYPPVSTRGHLRVAQTSDLVNLLESKGVSD